VRRGGKERRKTDPRRDYGGINGLPLDGAVLLGSNLLVLFVVLLLVVVLILILVLIIVILILKISLLILTIQTLQLIRVVVTKRTKTTSSITESRGRRRED